MQVDQDKFLRDLFLSDDLDFIESVYEIFLGRTADKDGRKGYLSKLRAGMGRSFILIDVARSSEAADKNLSVPACLRTMIERGVHPHILDEMMRADGETFVKLAYRTILGREANAGDLETYAHAIRWGTTRPALLAEIRYSEEGRRFNADVPGLDQAIRRYRLLKTPILGRLLATFGFGRERNTLLTSLGRIERNFEEFRNSSLGDRLAATAVQSGNKSKAVLDAKMRAEFRNTEEPSETVLGNPALPGRIMAENISVKRILLLKLDHIGDFFISVRPMVMLREAWPEAHITLVCGPWNVGLAKGLGIFDEVHAYTFFTAKTGEEEFDWDAADWEMRCDGVRNLGLGHYDLAIDLRHDSDTRPILNRINTRFKIGFASPGGSLPPTPPLDLFLLEIPPDLRDQLHAETRLVALAALVIETFRPPAEHPVRRLLGLTSADFRPPFDGRRPYMVVAPGAGSPNRTWAPENFVKIMRQALDEWGMGLVVIGPRGEAPVNSEIVSHFDPADCVDLTGGALTDLPAVIEAASLYVGNDTGGGHLAAMLGTPTLSVYAGVSDPRVWQPIGPKVSIAHSRTPCSYCHINLRKDCHHELRCLTEITTDLAWSELSNLKRNYCAHPQPIGQRGEVLTHASE